MLLKVDKARDAFELHAVGATGGDEVQALHRFFAIIALITVSACGLRQEALFARKSECG